MFKPTPHPVLKLPTPEQVREIVARPAGREELAKFFAEREAAIKRMEVDPWRYGYRPPIWDQVSDALKGGTDEALVLGGNRSSKSEFAAWHVVDSIATKDNQEWAMFHSSHDSSIRQQHARIYRYLPPEWRDLGKQGKMVNVCYTVKNGFSEHIFILPNGSRCYFFNYQQDPRVIEGYEWDGAWCDELVPIDYLEAIRYRLITRRGKLITTFTPVEGYTQTVADFLAGSEPVRSERAPLLAEGKVHVRGCPPGEMPRELICQNRGRKVFFFFTSDNVFSPYEEMVAKLDGATEAKVKERAYGWPEKQVGNAFPRFGRLHVVSADRVPGRVSRYRAADPGIAKNWFIKWYAVDELGRTYVYREWPDKRLHGEWALPCAKNPDGKPGPAQRSEAGRGILDYKRLILELEGWVWDDANGEWDGSKAETITDSVIDPRLGGAEVPSEEEGTSIIMLMEREQRDSRGRLVGPSMVWRAGPGGQIADGIQLLNDRMDWDTTQELTALNSPRWYVVDTCEQSVFAYREYTGLGGEKGALKDIIDPDRYFVKSDWGYIDESAPLVAGGGTY
jgi:phage terminase large subunit-like protein